MVLFNGSWAEQICFIVAGVVGRSSLLACIVKLNWNSIRESTGIRNVKLLESKRETAGNRKVNYRITKSESTRTQKRETT